MNSDTQPDEKQQEPWKDPIVDRLFDYTKWHIGLNAVVLTYLASGLAVGKNLPGPLMFSVYLLAIAGIASGTLASSLSRREKWKGFLETRTWPLLPETENSARLRDGLTMGSWSKIQHGALWAAIFWGVGVATYYNINRNDPAFVNRRIEEAVTQQLVERNAAKRIEEELAKQLAKQNPQATKYTQPAVSPSKD